MASPDHLKAELQSITRHSLAELRSRLLADETLPLARRRDMASALASLAKALGCPPETVSADPVSLRPLLAGLTPAMVGLKPGRWRNVLSLATAALAHFGIVVVQGRIREKPSPEWLTILDLLGTEAMARFHLWRFARDCTQLSIQPGTGTCQRLRYTRVGNLSLFIQRRSSGFSTGGLAGGFVLIPAGRGSNRDHACVRLALRNGTQWGRSMRRGANGGGHCRYRLRCRDGGRHVTIRRPQSDQAIGQAAFFGVGGLIHAAVGLAGGIGGFSTKRSGFSRNARSSVVRRAA